jgi:hypothetical protein
LVDGKGFSPYVQICPTATIPARGITELDRLAYVVRSIEFNCQIAPIGSFKKNTLGEISRNEAFNGLDMGNNFKLSAYQLLRPTCQDKSAKERKADIFCHEFLDKVDLEKPANSWTVLKDQSK